MLLSEERLRQQGKLGWLCPSTHGHVTVKWGDGIPQTSNHCHLVPSSNAAALQAAEGRVRCKSVQLQTLETSVRVT
jgi:hypothetical protein